MRFTRRGVSDAGCLRRRKMCLAHRREGLVRWARPRQVFGADASIKGMLAKMKPSDSKVLSGSKTFELVGTPAAIPAYGMAETSVARLFTFFYPRPQIRSQGFRFQVQFRDSSVELRALGSTQFFQLVAFLRLG